MFAALAVMTLGLASCSLLRPGTGVVSERALDEPEVFVPTGIIETIYLPAGTRLIMPDGTRKEITNDEVLYGEKKVHRMFKEEASLP